MNGAVPRCDLRTRINDRQEVSRHIRTVTRARIRGKEGNIMKPFGTISTTALLLLLGLAVPAHARQEKQEEKASPPRQEQQAKPEKQEQAKPQKQQQAKPEKQAQAKPEKQQQAKPQQQQKQQQQQAKSEKQQQQKTQQQAKGQQKQQQEQAKSNKQQQKTQEQAKGQQKQQQEQAKSNKQQHQQQTASSHGGPQRTQKAMATQRSQPALRLSERGSGRIPDDRFRSHFGREHHFHMGNPVMVGGYSRFQYGGFWFGFVDPWPVGWYYTDDFYIDYVDGGYYMYNPYYPGARFAITVVI
jgi:DNA polymerase III gamma/tau subunit